MNISHIIHILESGDKKADKREEKTKAILNTRSWDKMCVFLKPNVRLHGAIFMRDLSDWLNEHTPLLFLPILF